MDFSLTPEQEALAKSTIAFATDVIAPGASQRDKDGTFDLGIWKKTAEAGLVGLPVGEEYGGGGGSVIDACVANEALGYGGHDGGFTLSFGAHWVISQMPIYLHGSTYLKEKWLPKLTSGDMVGCWASTEPDVGSDAGAIKTTAVRDADGWLINGSKMFITNAPIAGVCTVLAKTSDKGATAFVVDTTTPGFSVGPNLDKMGCRSSPTSAVYFDNVRVRDEDILGEVDTALWTIAFECFDWERIVMVASGVGGMQATLEASITYAKQRKQFGKPIGQHQAVGHKLAEMKINVEVARNAVYKAAWLKQHGMPHQMEASIAKTLVGKLSVENALEAIQIHGGYGYLRDFPVERALRDSKLAMIGGGTSEIQKMIISRMLLAD